MSMTPLGRVKRTAKASTAARRTFEQAIRDAHPTYSVRQIAEAAGLSPARVHQIIQEAGGTKP